MLKTLKRIKYHYTQRRLRGCLDHQMVKGMLSEGHAPHIGYMAMMGEAPRDINKHGISCVLINPPLSCDIALTFRTNTERSAPVAQFIRMLSSLAMQCDFADQAVTETVTPQGLREERIFLAAPLAYAVYGSLIYILQTRLDEARQTAITQEGSIPTDRQSAAYYRPLLTPSQYSEAVLHALQNGLYEFCSGHPRLGGFTRAAMAPHTPDFGYPFVADALSIVTQVDINLGVFDILHTPVKSEEYDPRTNHPHWFDKDTVHTPLVWEPPRYSRAAHTVMEMVIRQEQAGRMALPLATRFKLNLPLIDSFLSQVKERESFTQDTTMVGATLSADGGQVSESWRRGEETKQLAVRCTLMGLVATVTTHARMEDGPDNASYTYLMSGCAVATYQLALPPARNEANNPLRYTRETRNSFFNRLGQLTDIQQKTSDMLVIGHGGYIATDGVHMPLPPVPVNMDAVRSMSVPDGLALQKEITEWCQSRVNGRLAPTQNSQRRLIDLS